MPNVPVLTSCLLDTLQEYIEAVDAVDNGISQYDADVPARYRTRTDISSRVGHLNPAWNQPFDGQTVDVSRAARVSYTDITMLIHLYRRSS